MEDLFLVTDNVPMSVIRDDTDPQRTLTVVGGTLSNFAYLELRFTGGKSFSVGAGEPWNLEEDITWHYRRIYGEPDANGRGFISKIVRKLEDLIAEFYPQ